MNTKVTPCEHGTESVFEQWWARYAETITPFTTPKQFASDAYAAGMADPMVAHQAVVCCGLYDTCLRACTPRGEFLGGREAEAAEEWLRVAEIGNWRFVVWLDGCYPQLGQKVFLQKNNAMQEAGTIDEWGQIAWHKGIEPNIRETIYGKRKSKK